MVELTLPGPADVLAAAARIAGLQAMLGALEEVVSCCHGDTSPECPILDELEKG